MSQTITPAASTYNVTLIPYPNLESHFPIDSTITQLPNDPLIIFDPRRLLVTPYNSPLRPISSPELVTVSSVPSLARMIHVVSSPSNLGTRGCVSIGTPVDPWMVRPIKGTFGQVDLRLGRSVLRGFELQSQKKDLTYVEVSTILCTN